MYIEQSKVNNVENFNDVNVADKINVKIRDTYRKTIMFYGILDDTNLEIFTSSISQTDIEEIQFLLNEQGIDNVTITTNTKVIFENKDNNYTQSMLSLEDLKIIKIDKLKLKFKLEAVKPEVDLGNGLLMDGGRQDIMNFEAYRDLLEAQGVQEGTIRGSDNVFHTLTLQEISGMILQLKGYGLQAFQDKWTKEAQIMGATSIQELDSIVI